MGTIRKVSCSNHINGECDLIAKDKWEHRAARMRPQHSRMELDVLLLLNKKGKYPWSWKPFCIQSTEPDYFFEREQIAVYLDGEKAHAKRADRDSRIRELLEKRHGVRVVSITYRGNSHKEQQRVLNKILEELK